MKRIAIFDIDGTLSDHSKRLYLVTNGLKEYKHYYDLMCQDEVLQPALNILNQLKKTHRIILLTGRPDNYRKATEMWLVFNSIHYDDLLMRKAGNKEQDYIIKERYLKTLDIDKIDYVFDDRTQCIEMFKRYNLNVIDAKQLNS